MNLLTGSWRLRALALGLPLLACPSSAHARADEETLAPFKADYGEFDGKDMYHLVGHVELDVPGMMELRCQDLVIASSDPAANATNSVITATGEVRVHLTRSARGTNAAVDITAYAGKAVYTGTNSMFVLTENPRVITPQGTLTATTIYHDLKAGKSWARPFQFVPNPQNFKVLEQLNKKTGAAGSSPK
jgi:lipopolysaccharide export system protein LptA